jgi:hypothetical protein
MVIGGSSVCVFRPECSRIGANRVPKGAYRDRILSRMRRSEEILGSSDRILTNSAAVVIRENDPTFTCTGSLKRKQDWDQTGNGVNHPNDFGHRVYAQVILKLLEFGE